MLLRPRQKTFTQNSVAALHEHGNTLGVAPTPFIKSVFEFNGLCDGTYIEPYAGGASVACELLLEGYAWDIVINDIDPAVYAFWWAVINDTDTLVQRIKDVEVTVSEWQRQRNVYAHVEDHSLTDVAFATFFLNRSNRSGILNAGIIGGKEQLGNYKIDARFNKADLIGRIEQIASYGNRIHLYKKDALDFLSHVNESYKNSTKVLMYLDPPYYVKGKQLYRNFYTHDDHVKIASQVGKLDIPWIVTYDNAPEISALYANYDSLRFSLTYSVNVNRDKGTEQMFVNKINLPTIALEKISLVA